MDSHRRLTLLRHAEAQAPDPHREDRERALTRRGIRDAEVIARRLLARGWVADLVVTSTATRTRQTADLLARVLALPRARLVADERLYEADPATIWRVACERGAEVRHLLICAHNPGSSELASRFGPVPQRRRLGTAAFASALFEAPDWASVAPEEAIACVCDDPAAESPADRRSAQL
ncbi:MAG: histidine phosphatase family protein [Gammaproteobacteria bacterium]|nr:histidine phosphatase family protein [Gammaproteobacteria bacterium]